jgi:hypothetical protein
LYSHIVLRRRSGKREQLHFDDFWVVAVHQGSGVTVTKIVKILDGAGAERAAAGLSGDDYVR